MRAFGRIASSSSSNPKPPSPSSCSSSRSRQSLFPSSSYSSFSSSGSGSGRGRGRGSSSSISRAPGSLDSTDADIDDSFLPPPGTGHGRGKPLPSSSILPSFSSWVSSIQPSAGRGQPVMSPEETPTNLSKKPIFFRRDDDSESPPKPQFLDPSPNLEAGSLPRSILSGLPGAGRGKPVKMPDSNIKPAAEENRHLRPRMVPRRDVSADGVQQRASPSPPRLSREEAVKKAVGILSRGGGGVEEGGRGRGFRGQRGRGRAGRGGRGTQAQRWRGDRGGPGRFRGEEEDDSGSGLYLGDNADGEALAQRLGADKMNELVEAFEDMSYRVLPSPMDDAYLDALHTNNMIEYEEEYLMGEFDRNPDIDEKPPIPLRDALEKMKPFLMAYEGIQSQEEWEEVMKETMEKVPYLEQLIEFYSGPERVTAKQQQEELERVAKTLPENIPSSVKRFTDRALLSLQSNPGWGFDKKCQFMDKLVWEVSQQYK